MTNLAAPTDTASALMEKLGMEFFDSNGKMKSMTEVIQILEDKTSGMTQQQKASTMETLFGKEAMSGMLSLVSQGPEKFEELTKSLSNCDGASADMAGTMQDNLAGSIEAMKGSVETAAIRIGDVLAPTIRSCANWISDMVNKFSALPKPMQEFIVKIGIVAAAIGPALIILAKLIESVRTVMSVFNSLKTAASVFTALPAIMNPPVLIIIAIIAAIAFIVYEVIKNWDSLKVYFQAFFDFCKKLFNSLYEFFAWVFNGIGDFISSLVSGFEDMCSSIGDLFSKAIEGWKLGWNAFVDFMSEVGSFIVDGLLGGLLKGWDKVKETASDLASTVKDSFKSILGINSPSKVFTEYGEFIGQGLAIGVDNEESNVKNKFTKLANGIKDIGGNIKLNPVGFSSTAINGLAVQGNSSVLQGQRAIEFKPSISMQVSIADTGNKGTQQLTSEVRSMAQTAIKNGMIDQFMSDALRL